MKDNELSNITKTLKVESSPSIIKNKIYQNIRVTKTF